MVFRKKAFNHYDTFFCSGEHHKKELEQTEKLYKLNKIQKVKFGYNKIDELLKNSIKSNNEKNQNSNFTIIVSPSWGENCILEKFGERLLSVLKNSNWKIIIRPHPDTIRKFKKQYIRLKNKYQSYFDFEEKISNMESFYNSSIMITDWSGAAFEFAFGLEKPVIFIDVPKKINNPDYNLYETTPIEISIRKQIGEVISINEISNINQRIEYVFTSRKSYKEKIRKIRKKVLYNIGNSSKVGANYINQL